MSKSGQRCKRRIEVLRQIKADAKLKAIPVVMLTTSADEREMVESYNYGANSYIVKPVGFEQFVKAIKELKLYWLVLNSLPREHRPKGFRKPLGS